MRARQQAHQRPDTPADVADRLCRNVAGRLARLDREAAYPQLTHANVAGAIAYQARQYAAHYRRLRAEVSC